MFSQFSIANFEAGGFPLDWPSIVLRTNSVMKESDDT